ncbi:chemotaxis protein [Pseudomonas aeruginosa]|nr:chemotaxis protein [Pseudomonas aeruginosa]
MSKRIESYQQVNIRAWARALQDLGKQLAPLPDRVARLEQRDPTTLSFSQAARLVGLGASAEDLTQACGLSQAEAELVARLHEARDK